MRWKRKSDCRASADQRGRANTSGITANKRASADQRARANSSGIAAHQRTRATADQIGLNAQERRANVQNAFQTTDPRCAGKNIALIDDVCTTGATLDACAAVLFANGARGVYGLTIARAR